VKWLTVDWNTGKTGESACLCQLLFLVIASVLVWTGCSCCGDTDQLVTCVIVLLFGLYDCTYCGSQW